MEALLQTLDGLRDTYYYVYIGFMRYLAPALVLLILARCAIPLLTFRRVPEIVIFITLLKGRA